MQPSEFRAAPYYPIIYVRGYAGRQDEVEETVDDPFYGFNKGSTHIRVGPKGGAHFFAFESPLVRLMTDHGYSDVFEGAKQTIVSGSAKNLWKTIWIYRYYDPTSKTFDQTEGGEKRVPERLEIEEAAEGLKELIDTVKEQTGAEKVILVAHSMGGLVCRSLIQKRYIEANDKASNHVDKLFTYGSPHGGIHFGIPGGGILEWVRDKLGVNNCDDFGEDRMYQYLTPNAKKKKAPADFAQNSLNKAFDEGRVFSVVGTNAHDYAVLHGLSRRSVGPQSDGLVQIQHAYVKGSHRAYIHRSHSGRYGMVNSEEGYQNLQRFLFGDRKVKITLIDATLRTKGNVTYHLDVRFSIRGLPVLLNEQTAKNYCPIMLDKEAQTGTCPLFTTFLNSRYSTRDDKSCRYTLGLSILPVAHEKRTLIFTEHIQDLPIWSDWLIVDVVPDPAEVLFTWASTGTVPTEKMELETLDNKGRLADVVMPGRAKEILGDRAKLRFEIFDWK